MVQSSHPGTKRMPFTQLTYGPFKRKGILYAARLFLAWGIVAAVGPSLAYPQDRPPNLPEGVEYYANEGHQHISEGKRAFYKTDPPTSGPHDPRWLPPSIYEAEETRPELLVHNLEHGNIVIYFDRSGLSKPDIAWLSELTHKHIGQWDGVLMVSRDDKKHPIILTAWRAILRLEKLDQDRVLSFVDFFRGRGPENQVR
ncbi:MAG: DUF3105 domain-containing protein [Nitrospiria bacterium]